MLEVLFYPLSSNYTWSSMDIIWTMAFFWIVITAVLGNCLVIWIVCGELSWKFYQNFRQTNRGKSP